MDYIHYNRPLPEGDRPQRRCRGIINRIDGELLTAYQLPFHLEQDLLEYFEKYKRPGPLSLTQIKSSPTKRFYTSIIRVEAIRNEDSRKVIDAVIVNWNPHQIIHIPLSLIPANLQETIDTDTRLLAKSHLTNLPALGFATGSCCGGTILIRIDGKQTTYFPEFSSHRKFISNTDRIPTPMCLLHLSA